jgi:hypothetical protein
MADKNELAGRDYLLFIFGALFIIVGIYLYFDTTEEFPINPNLTFDVEPSNYTVDELYEDCLARNNYLAKPDSEKVAGLKILPCTDETKNELEQALEAQRVLRNAEPIVIDGI